MTVRFFLAFLLTGIALGQMRFEKGKANLPFLGARNGYAVLYRSLDLQDWQPVDIVRSRKDEDNILSDPLLNLGGGYYRIEHPSDSDSDGDGTSDFTELIQSGREAVFNAARSIPSDQGVRGLDQATFNRFAKRDDFPGASNVQEVKFLITDIQTNPKLYFFNVNRTQFHIDFARETLNLYPGFYNSALRRFNLETYRGDSTRRNLAGSIVYHPNSVRPDGTKGVFTLEFWPADAVPGRFVTLAYRLITTTSPFFEYLAYHPASETQTRVVSTQAERFEGQPIHMISTESLLGDLSYQPLNQKIAFGRLVIADGETTLSSRDIVIFKNLPNDLPKVAGIVTELPQTPLSHVNLKARQADIPNCFFADASTSEPFLSLLGKVVRYQVTATGVRLREATEAELNAHLESTRPTQASFPPRDLSVREIRPFSQLGFRDARAFGAKTANLAELRTIQPTSTPDGFGIPFHFYDEFMKENNFYQEARTMIAGEGFKTDPEIRRAALSAFRKRIRKSGRFSDEHWQAIGQLQNDFRTAFGEAANPRLRSSANAEDTVDFSGAGLYNSYTHRPGEGHLGNSVKQVYASLWTYRAYEEREFYRVDHFASQMGVTVHPNYDDEQVNGVAVARNIFDPNWEGYYLNSQVGEDLVTNPEAGSTPEELLVADFDGETQYEFQYIRRSNRVEEGGTVLSRADTLELVAKLRALNSHFQSLYRVSSFNTRFAMEVEFKITAAGDLEIKQARPYND